MVKVGIGIPPKQPSSFRMQHRYQLLLPKSRGAPQPNGVLLWILASGSVASPEGLPFWSRRQGPQLHERPDMLNLPARPGLLESLVQQLLDRPFHQPTADGLPTPQPHRVVQPGLVARKVVEHPTQRRPVAAQGQLARQFAHPLRYSPIAVGQQPLLAAL